MPPNTTFTLATTSTGTEGLRVNVTFNTIGSQSVTATDTVNSSITGSASINVTSAPAPAVATQYSVGFASGATSVVVGTAIPVYITAETASGGPVNNYTGTAAFTSSDLAALLPANTTFTLPTSSTSGEGIRVLVTFNTVGTQTFTATDAANPSITGSATINVTSTPPPAVTTQYHVFFAGNATSVVAGTPIGFYVTPETASGGSVNDYTGTAGFTSSDLAALLPANTTFTLPTSSTAGEGIRVNVTFNTVGSQSLTATDTANSSIFGTAGINVTAPVPVVTSQYHVFFAGNATSVVAGTQVGLYVIPETASGGAVNNYTGTAGFTSTDLAALLPPNTTFTLPATSTGGEGIRVNVTFNTVGQQSITAADTTNAMIVGSASINVTPVPVATQFSVKLATSSTSGITPGTTTYAYVVPEDAAGQAVSNYSGTVHFTSNDTAAVLPADYTFTPTPGSEEYARVAVVFNTPGSVTLTATDTATPSITGTSSGATITPYQNPVNPLDVIGNGGAVVPLDAVAEINYLNLNPSGVLPSTPTASTYFYDVTGTGTVTPKDVLLIVNYLNTSTTTTTTESTAATTASAINSAATTAAVVTSTLSASAATSTASDVAIAPTTPVASSASPPAALVVSSQTTVAPAATTATAAASSSIAAQQDVVKRRS